MSQASKKGEQIVERLNSGDYMDAGEIVKARRRQGLLLNTGKHAPILYGRTASKQRQGS